MNNPQLELFPQVGRDGQPTQARTVSLLYSLRHHEKVILLIILFIASSIISFSLGVEKGKGAAAALVKKAGPQKTNPAPLTVPPVITTQGESTREKNNSWLDNYTIQVASYKTRASAEKEASVLKKRGLTCLILTKGNYTVLYVGRFTDRESAKSLLSELKKRYRDCIIRRL